MLSSFTVTLFASAAGVAGTFFVMWLAMQWLVLSDSSVMGASDYNTVCTGASRRNRKSGGITPASSPNSSFSHSVPCPSS